MANERQGSDFRTDAFQTNPYPRYAHLRKFDPIHENPLGFVLLTRYSDCLAALRDQRFGKEGLELLFKDGYIGEYAGKKLPPSILFSNPPNHTRMRALVAKAVTERYFQDMSEGIQQIVEQLLAKQRNARAMDFMSDFANQLPFNVLCQMFSIPTEDMPALREWSGQIALTMDAFSQSDELVLKRREAKAEFIDYFHTLIEKRKSSLGEDCLSRLIRIENAGDRLSTGELIATCALFFVAGHETSVNLLGNGMLALLQHPDQMRRLREDPTLFDSAFEEILRYDAPIQRVVRLLGEDVQLANRNLKKGRIVVLALGAANRDPAYFSNPDQFDILREARRNLSFGFGIHYCLGASLARLEARIIFSTFLSQFRSLKLTDEQFEWRPSFTMRGLQSLQIAW